MICVDALRHYPNKPFGHEYWAHMWSDTDNRQELIEFARRIGLRREWIQDGPKHELLPHFDVTRSKHELALLNGAVLMDIVPVMEARIAARKEQREREEAGRTATN